MKDGLGVTVAVIDSGIDTTHPDLVGKLVPGYDFYNDDSNTDDDNAHGTHVAGVIAANTNNLKGIAGVAYNAKLLPVKVCGAAGNCPSYEIAAGLVFAVDKGAKVANMSLGGSMISTTIQGAVQYALSRNVTVVAAAGNTGGTGYQYPASYDGVISVAAHDINGDHATFSTANNRVTVSAPGVSIVSTVPLEFDNCGVVDGICGGATWSGTSMATPHVSGIVALMVSDNVVSTPAAAREALICSAWDAGTAGYDNQFGYGWVQADWAMNWRYNTANCKVTAPNDLYQNATNIPLVPFTTTQAVHSRSVTASASDPAGCVTPAQTLWYKFKPTITDYYQITTFGSSYDTVLSVWQMPEEGHFSTNYLGCNDDVAFSLSSILNVPLTAGQTYYIMVNSLGIADDQILNLDVRRSLVANNIDTQESSPNIFYSGSWLQTAATGASGGQVKTTTDNSAVAVFTFRGVGFELARTISPTQGSLEIWIDNVLVTTLNNRGAVLKRNQASYIPAVAVNGNAGAWHQVVLRRSAGGPAGPVDIDRIKTYEANSLPNLAITVLTDDSLGGAQPCAAKRFCYENGTFTVLTMAGANLGKVTQTTDTNARISFRATGSTITIFRNTGPGFGTMDVYVDGLLVGNDVSNASGALRVKVPYVISGLGNYSHVVQIVNNAGGTLQFDAAQAGNPVALAASTLATNENSPSLVYSGFWSNLAAVPGAVGSTVRQASDPGAAFSFSYTGNWFYVTYRRTLAGANVSVYQDGQFIGNLIDPGGVSGSFVTWSDPNLRSDRLHTVRFVVNSGTFEIDAIHPRRQVVITPSMGLIQETNAAITYNTAFGNWTNFTGRSMGGYTFQGGAARTTTVDGARLSFYVNGTGFLLYTSLDPLNSGWEVYVDGVLFPVTFQNNSYNFIDLGHPTLAYRFRPIAYAITGLTPGIHRIELRKWNCVSGYVIPGYSARTCPTTDFIDFDGVRVFP